MVPNGIDDFEFLVVQALEVHRVLIDVVRLVLGDLCDGLDHGDRFFVTHLFFDLFHLLSKAKDLQGVSFATLHNSVLELFLEYSDEHLVLDEHLGGGHAKFDGILDAVFLGVGQTSDGGDIHMG